MSGSRLQFTFDTLFTLMGCLKLTECARLTDCLLLIERDTFAGTYLVIVRRGGLEIDMPIRKHPDGAVGVLRLERHVPAVLEIHQ